MKTLVVGLGNPILGDDGVGWKVAETVEKLLPPGAPIDVDYLSLGGISLMEHLIGYDHVYLIDAFASDEPVGSISVMKLSDLPNYSAFHTTSTHDTSLQNAIELGKLMKTPLPNEVTVIGVAIARAYDFSEDLSAPVAEAVPLAAKILLNMLARKMPA
ncbi:MAG: hydrogenase maturation protease [Chloroflexi bacterium]|nr:hydrogenase maturation protease [Chloroflexota bacterium]